MVFIPLNFQSETNVFRSVKFPIGNQCVSLHNYIPLHFLLQSVRDSRGYSAPTCDGVPDIYRNKLYRIIRKNAVDVFNVSKRKAAEKRCFNS